MSSQSLRFSQLDPETLSRAQTDLSSLLIPPFLFTSFCRYCSPGHSNPITDSHLTRCVEFPLESTFPFHFLLISSFSSFELPRSLPLCQFPLIMSNLSDMGYLFASAPRVTGTINKNNKNNTNINMKTNMKTNINTNTTATATTTTTTTTYSHPPKYRDIPANIMFDKRVVRGPTVQSKGILIMQPQAGAATFHSKQQTLTRTQQTITNDQKQTNQLDATISNGNTLQFTYNTAASVQTDDYLEDLINDVTECDSFAQTDDLHTDLDVNRVLALFAPAVRGVDASTCIEGQELFDFDVEVESILAVLVGKALDQAEIEVNEEQELAALTKQRATFAAERARVIAETMRLEAENTRRMEERQRRYEQERERVTEQQRIVLQREAAHAAQQAMLELERRTQAEIKAQWKDPVKQQVENSFIPWLAQSVAAQLAMRREYAERVDALILAGIQAIDHRVSEHLRIAQERKEREVEEVYQAELAFREATERETKVTQATLVAAEVLHPDDYQSEADI